MIGETFGNYRILEKRGEGGMGMFFKATDLQLDRIVGLKTLRPELLADAGLRQRLQTEARSLARLVHQNIANVLHYLVEGEHHFIVMEYVEGRDLADLVRETGVLPFERLGPIVAQICAAISFAHSKGVIHRDLKPSNIMVTADWSVKVTDFGIAKILGDEAQTRTGMAAGSLHYMAPEQIRARGVDSRSDIYQLGATLFELTTGRRPFISESEYELMTMHLQDPPPAPSSVSDRVFPALDTVILKALAKEPDDRFQSAAELNTAFRAALAEGRTAGEEAPTVVQVSAPEEKTTFAPSPPKRAPSRPSRRRASDTPSPKPTRALWPWLAGIGVVVAAVLAIWLWPRSPDTERPTVTEPEVTGPPVADACTVLVTAQVPEGISDGQVARAVLRVEHPELGAATHDVFPTNGNIRHTLTLEPTSDLSLAVEGFDSNGDPIFTGATGLEAPEGMRVETTIPVRALPPPGPSQNVVLNITPFDARNRIERVWIDGTEATGSDLLKHRLSPGRHKIRLQVGMDRLTDTVIVASSGQTEKSIFIGSGRGRLSVAATFPGGGGYADIWLDGESTGLGTPKLFRDVLQGPHEVEVRKEGFRSREGARIIEVQANYEVQVEFRMVER